MFSLRLISIQPQPHPAPLGGTETLTASQTHYQTSVLDHVVALVAEREQIPAAKIQNLVVKPSWKSGRCYSRKLKSVF